MSKDLDIPFWPSENICKYSLQVPKTCEENMDSLTSLEEAAKRRKMGLTPIGIIRMKVQELKWADVDKAGDLDIHPLEKDKYDYSIKQCDKIIAFIDNLPLTIAKESPVLNEAADNYQTTFNKIIGPFHHDDQKRAFIAGAKWQANQLLKGSPLPEDTVLFQKGVEEGKRLLTEEAVEGEIGYWNQRGLSIRLDKSLERLGYDMDTKVKIIIIKDND